MGRPDRRAGARRAARRPGFRRKRRFPAERLWCAEPFKERLPGRAAERLRARRARNRRAWAGADGRARSAKSVLAAARLPEEGVLIQRKYVGELRKWLDGDEIEVNLTDKRLFVRSGDGHETLSLPRAGYAYPDYSPFMTRLAAPDVSLLKLNRKDCLDALDRISIFNTESDRCTYFELSGSEVMLSAQGQDTGSANESLEVSYNGSIGRIAFPTKTLMEILTHYQSGELTLTLTGAEGPCGINGTEDPDYTVLIMPMKIAEESYYEEN